MARDSIQVRISVALVFALTLYNYAVLDVGDGTETICDGLVGEALGQIC